MADPELSQDGNRFLGSGFGVPGLLAPNVCLKSHNMILRV